MKLYLVHVGFYDVLVGEGFYESHINYFVVGRDVKEAKQKVLSIEEFKKKQMHIDGIKEISFVDGYKVFLEECSEEEKGKVFSYDESKDI